MDKGLKVFLVCLIYTLVYLGIIALCAHFDINMYIWFLAGVFTTTILRFIK
jgi:hypothetical protein